MNNDPSKADSAQKRPQLTAEERQGFAARVATILRASMPASAYFVAVQRAWDAMPLSTGHSEFNLLLIWVSGQTKKCGEPWYRFFQEYTDKGIRALVWEHAAASPPPLTMQPRLPGGTKANSQSACSPETSPPAVSKPRLIRSKTERSGPVDALVTREAKPQQLSGNRVAADTNPASAGENGWGEGSLRLGPRWTTSKKDADFYSYAEVRFDEDK